ncbi:glutamate decarboxylase, partial [Shigella dysenteriae]
TSKARIIHQIQLIRGITINSFQMKRSCHAPFTSSLFLLCSRAVIKSKRNR